MAHPMTASHHFLLFPTASMIDLPERQHQLDMSIGMMGTVFGHTNPFKGMQDVLKTGTPLVFTGMELDTINHDPIPAAHFALPAEPLTLEGVRKNMGASGQ